MRMVSESSAVSSQPYGSAESAAVPPVLAARDLGKQFRQGKYTFDAVRQVSLTLEAGEILAFLGPNGAGKTTTIKMIAGLVRPDRGAVEILGIDPHRSAAALKQVGAVLEGNRNTYWRLTPAENLAYFGVLKGLSRQQAHRRGLALLEQFGLMDKQHTPVQRLSRGMQQKLAIAVALIHQPKLLLLDEPTLGLDVEAGTAVKALVQQIAAEGCAILLTTHQLDVAEALSHRVAIIRKGQIVAEKPTQSLIQEFSESAFQIVFEGNLSAVQLEKVAALGGTVTNNQIYLPGDSRSLYRLFDLLRPLPLLEVKQNRADLTQVFLQLVSDENSL